MLTSFFRLSLIPAATLVGVVTAFSAVPIESALASDKKHEMDMSCMADMNGVPMSAMGPSMEAMECHMYVTPLRKAQPGDEEKARAVIEAVKATMERYRDYRKAIADGYIQANPKVKQPQYHFNNEAYGREADSHFDPTKPTSLLYIETPTQRFRLEGVMFTARPNATEDELNERIPLSVAHWHKHINFCAAPADKTAEYHGAHPRFGMFGSIHTKAACEAEHGTFMPTMFTWMIHVFPFEDDPKEVFSMNDDVAHVR